MLSCTLIANPPALMSAKATCTVVVLSATTSSSSDDEASAEGEAETPAPGAIVGTGLAMPAIGVLIMPASVTSVRGYTTSPSAEQLPLWICAGCAVSMPAPGVRELC